ncbi:VOC family protein [Maricaulis sp.]|uniref:VOC family protein n=1 Tax=Maricaulis sp. TaxID=1486257 RepID=UPI00262D5033|nr:VOC family protein [Maricaulis sp.]
MLGYVTLGTNDIERAAAFYDKICAEFGVGRLMESDDFIAWANPGGGCGIGLTKPFDGQPATVGNGVMIAFQAESKEQVDKVYKLAIELGAKDEGEAGPRGDGSFYAGYFRDPDGHKCNVFVM